MKDPIDSWNVLWDPKYKGQIIMKKDVRDSKNRSSTDITGDEIKDMIANGDAAMGCFVGFSDEAPFVMLCRDSSEKY